MDCNSRITEALATLKSELMSLRSQDVQLMKQMIGINDNIKRMTKRKRRTHKVVNKPCTEPSPLAADTLLVRVQSEPDYCTMRRGSSCGSVSSNEDFCSSLEDLTSCSECSEETDSEDVPSSPVFVLSEPTFGRRRSVAQDSSLSESQNSDAYYEDILKKNIKIWKYSKSISTESLNSVLAEHDIVEED